MGGALAASLSPRNIRGNYFLSLEARSSRSWVPQVANTFKTDQLQEVYKMLGNAPSLTKWKGEREREQLRDSGLTIVNDKFTSTIEVDKDDLDLDKTGQIVLRIRELGSKAAVLPDRLLTSLIEANGLAYDGVAYFGAHVKYATATNLLQIDITDTAKPTSAEFSDAILTAIQKMQEFKDDRGEPMHEDALEFLVMVPPKYWKAAKAAMANDFTSAGVSNTLKAAIEGGIKITIAVNSRLTAANNYFYVFRTDASVRALIWQERDIDDAYRTLGFDSENGFWKDQAAFGAKRIGQAALGRPELAYRIEFT